MKVDENKMPSLTEEQRRELIAALEILKPEVGEMQIPALSKAVDIALAALTAEPVAYHWRSHKGKNLTRYIPESWKSPRELTPLYPSQPVPALKPVVLPGDAAITTWHPGCGYEPEHAEGVRIGWNLRGEADKEAIRDAGYPVESE